jgi:outer membrane receptor protein involved in Fe transport
VRSKGSKELMGASALVVGIFAMSTPAAAQQSLPTIEVGAGHRLRATTPRHSAAAATRSVQGSAAPVSPPPQLAAASPQPSTNDEQHARLERLLPRAGVNVYTFDRKAIETLPQGNQATIDQILLQSPGVSQDSAVGGNFHVRNEHANVQYRVNGILLPDGVSGFGQVMDTGFVGSMSLVTGAMPAQYGLHTAGLIDIISRPPPSTPGGSVSPYGGSHATGQIPYEYGAKFGPWEVFTSGRLTMNNLGLQNPTSSHEALHDRTRQGRFFGFASYAIDDATKLTLITGTSVAGYQIPNTPNQPPQYTAYGLDYFDSAKLNENQTERTYYNVLALSKTLEKVDAQISYFSRYSTVHYIPDQIGDLIFNGIASNVFRGSLVNGLQGDIAYRVTDSHTLRAGFTLSGENTNVVNTSAVLPLNDDGDPLDTPVGAYDPNRKLGWIAGGYAQDEWKITDKLTLNAGLRFDQMWQYVSANQVSPRASIVFKPDEDTTFHVAYARYFTPPSQALSAPTNLAVYNNTVEQPDIPLSSPVRPERSNYFDAGITRRLTPELEAGVDFYYKRARNLLDDGQFGQAYVQTAFNYDRAYNSGVEVKSLFSRGDFRAYANLAWARQRGTQITSNQFLFDPDEFDYISRNYIYTDHAQTWTGSAGASYVLFGTRGSVSAIFGSGLRSGFANTTHVPPYTQINLGLSREIGTVFDKPLTLRFDIVNVLDHSYQLRDGSGIGVFAPQYGPRRGFFVGLKQHF